MKWLTTSCILLAVFQNVQRLEARLTLEQSSKSTEMLSNTLYISNNNNDNDSNNNNEIPEAISAQVEDEIEQAATEMKEQELATNLNDVKFEMNLQSNEHESQKKIQTNMLEKNAENYEKERHEPSIETVENIERTTMTPTTATNKATKRIIVVLPPTTNEKATPTPNTLATSKPMKVTTTTMTTRMPSPPPPSAATATPASNLKMQRPTSFINPFGQLSALFGSDQLQHLQDYNFLFNAERHTIFQLHTSLVPTTMLTAATTSNNSNNNSSGGIDVASASGRVLNVVGGSLGAAFGVNPVSAAGGPPAKVEEVQLYNAASLRQSRFNPFNPTRILIHGWFGGSHANVYNTLLPEYLKLGNGSYNIFTVDWGRGAFADYITASYRVKPVGKVVAKFIDFLHRESGMRFEDLHVVGFSMGAHIAGIAGKNVQTGRLPIIYALDPALPLFRYEAIDERVAITDADYVEVIHTSVGSYGYDRPLGHVDFYVNYGSSQTGCFLNECSHWRAFQVLAESLHAPNAFRGQGCDVKLWSDLIKNRRCLMGTGRNLTMGGNPTDIVAWRKRGGGVYYLTTNASPPYGKG